MALGPIENIMTVQAQPIQKQVAPPPAAERNAATPASADPNAYVDSSTLSVAKVETKDQNNEQGSSKNQEGQQLSPEQIKKAVDNLNKKMSHSAAVFGIHEKTNRITIKIVDKDTNELIKELPPEKTLDMIAKAWELAGLLVDEKR